MIRDILKVSGSSTAVKLLFDHYRNLGIASVIAYASVPVWKSAAVGVPGYFNKGVAISLGILGTLLFAVNEMHGIDRLHETRSHKAVKFVALAVHVMALYALFQVFGKH